MTEELNGDLQLSPSQRLRYLTDNFIRNFRDAARPEFASFSTWRLPSDVKSSAHGLASPGRILAEAFFANELPKLLSPGPVTILDIGCGSGRVRKILASAGYTGRYFGLDVDDRFDHSANPEGFESEFYLMDAHDLDPTPQFDLILSNSALEHIPDDARLIAKLRSCLKPGGVQFHIVPSGAALFAYLWHGYRQYAAGALGKRFDPANTHVYGLGGLGSLALHCFWITLPEMILRKNLRTALPRVYGGCTRAAFKIDRVAGFGAPMFAVCEYTTHSTEVR
jgi:SAM-dependent methyltransferase